ncbi:MAG: metallophosphoesterase [Alphaproteobacteria bacterium]|nr:metallophosphoesterase [Alphaproteobacteria bacterium]
MPPAATWIHLSDLHRGARGETRDWPVVRDAFARDLDRMARLVGAPDLVLFTGDLAFKGAEDEYAQVEALFDWLDSKLGKRPIYAVPGNHDMARPEEDWRFSWLFSEDANARAARADMLQRDPGPIAAFFEGYQRFAERRLALPGLATGLLPGDTRVSLDLSGFKLGLLGLNSAWRQYKGGDFQGHVGVDPHQVHALLPDGADAFRDAHHLTLLLQHHPPDWMGDRAQWMSHVATAGHVVLFGHMHANRAEVHRAESNEDRPMVQARSLCGLERYGTAREDRRFGYRWGRAEVVDLGADGLRTRVRTWSRTLVEGGRWRFVHPNAAEYEEAEGMRLVDVRLPEHLRPAPRPPAVQAPEGTPSAPSEGAELTRDQRYDVLVKLLPAQFNDVVVRSGAPMAMFSAREAPLAERAWEVASWVDNQPRETRERFDGLLRAKAGGLFE